MLDCDSGEEAEVIAKKLLNIGEYRDAEFLSVVLDEMAEADEVEKEKCCICLEYIKESKALLGCNHSFHLNCIYLWFNMKRTCPSCRKAVK
ncbi:hypothetical protein EROM_110870 [Encephalitozoon romaleae SJ-2008]|uniref:RING-type E3 ubiquitin transferase n=1 Tax=Encephalitozoon romaleae (strain SJ-2008) TaxID=1178016 RepID=I7AQB4_ENCRO|nr:hypothetical protein EROM_110870 [Encephalitozoon romaleae SJ-2008]AFN84069.1 hypothetical protein EROM_110870 [Encephalitozoon romaleae SJ-2008]